jgi:hypothetical protein
MWYKLKARYTSIIYDLTACRLSESCMDIQRPAREENYKLPFIYSEIMP